MKNIKKVNQYFNFNFKSEPIIFQGGCKDMKAVSDWNYKYLKDALINETLMVEMYKTKNDMNMMKDVQIKETSMKYFFDQLYNRQPPYNYIAEINMELDLKSSRNLLLNDIKCKLDKKNNLKSNLLFIGRNCNSACHYHITDDFVLNQIVGNKIVYLLQYKNEHISSRRIFSEYPNFSKENIFELNLNETHFYKAVLNPGDSLYIPPGWWHATEGIDFSCSVTKTYSRKDLRYILKSKNLFFLFAQKLFSFEK